MIVLGIETECEDVLDKMHQHFEMNGYSINELKREQTANMHHPFNNTVVPYYTVVWELER